MEQNPCTNISLAVITGGARIGSNELTEQKSAASLHIAGGVDVVAVVVVLVVLIILSRLLHFARAQTNIRVRLLLCRASSSNANTEILYDAHDGEWKMKRKHPSWQILMHNRAKKLNRPGPSALVATRISSASTKKEQQS